MYYIKYLQHFELPSSSDELNSYLYDNNIVRKRRFQIVDFELLKTQYNDFFHKEWPTASWHPINFVEEKYIPQETCDRFSIKMGETVELDSPLPVISTDSKNSVLSFKSLLKAKRYQALKCIPYIYHGLPGYTMKVLNEIDWSSDFTYHTRSEIDDPEVCSSIETLFEEVMNGKGCYWIGLEPFKFWVDVDFYSCENHKTIEEIVEVVSKYCKYWLVTKTLLADGSPVGSHHDWRLKNRAESYNIFTDRLVGHTEARRLEIEIAKKIEVDSRLGSFPVGSVFGDTFFFPSRSVIGPICNYMCPISYRRSPLSRQKWWPKENNPLEKKSFPWLQLSNLPHKMSDFDLFKFSYPNPEGV